MVQRYREGQDGHVVEFVWTEGPARSLSKPGEVETRSQDIAQHTRHAKARSLHLQIDHRNGMSSLPPKSNSRTAAATTHETEHARDLFMDQVNVMATAGEAWLRSVQAGIQQKKADTPCFAGRV